MANYAAENAVEQAGAAINERTGTAAADTVAAGSVVVWRNTGAGPHVITLTTGNTEDGLAVADQAITVPAGATWAGRVLEKWGDANGRVGVAIDGTAAEVKYLVLGGM